MRSQQESIRRAIVVAAVWRGALCIASLACFFAPWVDSEAWRFTRGGVVGTVPHERCTGMELLTRGDGPSCQWFCIAAAVGIVLLLAWQDYLLRRVKRGRVPSTSAEVFQFLGMSMIVEGVGLLLWQAGLFALLDWLSVDLAIGPVLSLASWLLVLLHTVVGFPCRLARACREQPKAAASANDPVRNALDWLPRWSLALAMLAMATWVFPWEERSPRADLPYWGAVQGLPISTSRLRWQMLLGDIGVFVLSWRMFGGVLLILWWSLWSMQRSRLGGAPPVTHAGALLAWGLWSVFTFIGLAAWSLIIRAILNPHVELPAPWACAGCFALCAALTLVFSPAMMWRAFRMRAREELQQYLHEAH